MIKSEAARLLLHAAAFDNRLPSEAASEAWAMALKDIPLDQDTLEAVARYYGDTPKDPGQRLWIQPHDVRRIRKTIRSERLEDFEYQPADPDETALEYLARRRGQMAAIASGQVPAQATRLALEPGSRGRMLELLAAVGTMPGEDGTPVRRGPLGIVCPTCNAPIGRRCRIGASTERHPIGRERSTPHPDRVATAAGQRVPSQADRREAEERVRQRSIAALARQGDDIPDAEIVEDAQ